MRTESQFVLFCICIGASFIFGLVYEGLAILRLPFARLKRGKVIVVFLLDIFLFALFSVWCIAIFYLFEFPTFRLYYFFGFFVGGIIYSKSLHRIVAFFKKICYNKLVKREKKQKNQKKIG